MMKRARGVPLAHANIKSDCCGCRAVNGCPCARAKSIGMRAGALFTKLAAEDYKLACELISVAELTLEGDTAVAREWRRWAGKQ